MIGALNGKIFDREQNPITVMVHGVGYSVFVPVGLLDKIKTNDTITLITYTYIREDALDIYGFETKEELVLFRHLIQVSGVGPRTALSVIDRGVKLIKAAIINADVTFFTSIPRLGKKNSQKIIIELKSKLGSEKDVDLSGTENSETEDIVEALAGMGFKKQEALKALKHLTDKDVTIEDKIKKALKHLAKQ